MMSEAAVAAQEGEHEEHSGSSEVSSKETHSENNHSQEGQQTSGTDSSETQERPGKPEWMSNKVWDDNFAKHGDDLPMEEVAKWYANSWNNAQEALHSRKEALAETVRDEIKAEYKKGVPESSRDYEFSQENLAKELGLQINMEADDPFLIRFQTWAHNNNVSQHEFNELSELYLEAVTTFFPSWDEEAPKLGDHADERVAHLNAFFGKNLSTEAYAAIENLPLSAELVMAFEEMMELSGVTSFTSESGMPIGSMMGRDEIIKLMDTDEYRNGDPATLRKVEAAWKKLSGQ